MNAIHRERDELNSVIQAWKDDYIFLLQSCITVANGDVADAWQMNLFGGNTVSLLVCCKCKTKLC